MTRQERLNIIINTLTDCSTFSGRKLLEEFSPIEVVDFSNHLVNTIPDTIDEHIIKTTERVFINWNKENIKNHCIAEINKLLRSYISHTYQKEKLIMLMYYIGVLYKLENESITKDLKNVEQYFESLLILDTEELREEVASNNIEAQTKNAGHYYTRVLDNFIILPTLKTKKQFSNFIP